MPITERTLKIWRKEALKAVNLIDATAKENARSFSYTINEALTLNNRILRMTQELLDQHLLRAK